MITGACKRVAGFEGGLSCRPQYEPNGFLKEGSLKKHKLREVNDSVFSKTDY